MEKPSLTEVWEALGGELPRFRKARCILPDHEDTRPSCSINEDKGYWNCFACGKGGDVYNLIMEVEGIGFPAALKRAEEITGESYKEVRGSSGGKPGYLVAGGKGDRKRSEPYVPAWLRGRSGGGS